MPMSLRRIFALIIFAAALVPALPAASQNLTPVKIGLGPAVDFLPAFVARDEGFFAKHGLDATLQVLPNPSVVPPMLVSDSVQISYATPPNLLLADDGGLDLVAIAGGARLVKTNAKISL